MKKIHQLAEPVGTKIPPLMSLLAFERAARQLSFRRAAKDLALSPSAISHQIRALEQRLGVRLFARAGRSVRLTTQGEDYLQSISGALATLETASRDLMRVQQASTEFTLSSLPFFTNTVLIPALEQFERDNPRSTLRIESTHQYADFDNSGVDAAIRFGHEQASGVKLEALLKVRRVPVCAPSLAQTGLQKLSDVRHQVLIHVGVQPQAWQRWAEEVGIGPLKARGNLWFDNVPSAMEAAAEGHGIALGMCPLIRARRDFGERIVTPFPNAQAGGETIYFATRPEQFADTGILALRRWVIGAMERALSEAEKWA